MTYSLLFPDHVAIECVDLSDTCFPLYDAEASTVLRATDRRKVEFSAGRHCARAAMVKLGYTPQAIPQNHDRAPRWPPGLVGSITHCAGYCAAAVAENNRFASIGIDAESIDAVPWSLANQILTEEEFSQLASLSLPQRKRVLTAMFSAKEAVYKAVYLLDRRILDFQDATVALDVQRGTFTAKVHAGGSSGFANKRSVVGAFHVDSVRVYAASWIS